MPPRIERDLAARLRDQRGRRRPTRGNAQQIAIDAPGQRRVRDCPGGRDELDRPDMSAAVGCDRTANPLRPHRRYALGTDRVGPFARGTPPAQVQHGLHLDAGIGEIEGGAVTVRVGGDHHGATPRAHAVEPEQPLRRRRHHDPRQVVVGEHQRLFDRARCHHHLIGAQFQQSPPGDNDGQQVVGEQARTDGVRMERDSRFDRLHFGGKPRRARHAGLACGVEPRMVEGAAEQRLSLDQRHATAGTRGLDRCGGAGCARADHRHIGMGVRGVVVARRRPFVDPAQAGIAAQATFPEVPGAARPVERAVIEADGQEPGNFLDPVQTVGVQAAAVMLAFDTQPVGNRSDVGRDVGFVGELHQGIGVVAAHAEHTAWPVILERAADQPDIVGGKRAGDRVTAVALVTAILEGEGDRPVAVQQDAVGWIEAVDAHGSLSPPDGSSGVPPNASTAG